MTGKIVTVIGATGVQGSSVINALLQNGRYTLRAITRNPDSEAARALAARGVQLAKADANDVDSLKAAFQGSYAVYAVTDFFEPFTKYGPAKAQEIEVQQGINMAEAAASTQSLEHYIWSTLPNATKISHGKYLIPHFEAKNKVDRYIKSKPELLAKTTFFWITFYAQNFNFPMFRPYKIPTAGKYVQFQSTPEDVPIKSVGDAKVNIGLFVRAILAQPEKTLGGKFVLAHYDDTTAEGLLQSWAKATGNVAQYIQVDEKTFHAIWPMWAEEMGVMMQFWDWAREKAWSGEEGILTKSDLNVREGLVGIEAAFAGLAAF
jgi:hypothetical protein